MADKTAALNHVRKLVLGCTRCPLHKERKRAVPGEGDTSAALMVVGEAPGALEDRSGKPFVGDSGQLLSRVLSHCGVDREGVFIGNVIKCRPPQNRDPLDEEILRCGQFLDAQIALVRPRVLLALGRFAANYLADLSEPQSLSWHRRQELLLYENETSGVFGVPIYTTYHPSYVLRRVRENSRHALALFVQDVKRAVERARVEEDFNPFE